MKIRQPVLAMVVTAVSLLLLPATAHADVNNFVITNFQGDYYLSKNDPQGALDIHEVISVDFSDQNHGILRALPERYNGRPLKIHIEKVELNGNAEQFSTYTQNGNLVLKIGDPNHTITGAQTYDIDYSVRNVMRFLPDHDELDWNINGDQWSQPFEQVTATLHLPNDLRSSLLATACYTGSYGQSGHDCTAEPGGGNPFVTYAATRTLQDGETLTIRADFKHGSFTPPGLKDWLGDYGLAIAEAVVLPLVALIAVGGYWFRKGRDLKGRGTIIPEYGPPDNLKPAEVDVVAHYKLSTKAISATVIDLAIKKYLRIIEVDKKRPLGLGTTKDYQLELLNNNWQTLSDYEQEIMDGIFSVGPAVGTTIDISTLQNKFYMTSKAVQNLIPIQLTTLGYFAKNPTKAGNSLHLVGFGLLAVGFFAHLSAALDVGLVLVGLICLAFAFLMPRRTAKGVTAEETIKGLKMYMEVAEKDRLAMLQSPDAPYAERSNEPVKTVDLFEKLLPYAMVLGVEDKWAQKFADIYKQPPNWYAGNWTAFNAVYFTSALNASVGAMSSSFSPPRSSGSGGGFAGGGGGGGGGGGW